MYHLVKPHINFLSEPLEDVFIDGVMISKK